MRRSAISGFVVLLATSAFAQNITEKIEVNLVNVDVTVTSRGNPARGLTRDDFEVLEDGVPQPITNFYAIENAREKTAPAAVTETAAPAPPDERFRRKVLVIIDNRHTTRHNRDVALEKLEKFIDERFTSGAYDWSVAMISERTYLLLPLTSDKARLHEALTLVRNSMSDSSMRRIAELDDHVVHDMRAAAQMTDERTSLGAQYVSDETMTGIARVESGKAKETVARMDATNNILQTAKRFQQAADVTITYSAIRDATRSFANTPGRKIVLLLTSAFADEENAINSREQALAAQHTQRLASLRERLIREANVSNASLYIVDTEGLNTLNATASAGQDEANAYVFGDFAGSAASVGGPLYWIAQETGGRMFTGNFIERSFRDFDAASSDFYSLAYRPNHPIDNKYHTIIVRVKKPGRYMLAYRTGYSAVAVEQQLSRAMTSAMAAEIQQSTMPLTMSVGAPSTPDPQGGVIVPVFASVPSSQLQFVPVRKGVVARIDFYMTVFDERGRIVTTFRTVREARANNGTEAEGNFVESDKVRLRKGVPYRIVVAVHDQVSDAVGIKSQDVRF